MVSLAGRSSKIQCPWQARARGDPAALAGAIGTRVASASLRRELGTAVCAVVEKRFDIQRVVTQYLSLYTALHS